MIEEAFSLEMFTSYSLVLMIIRISGFSSLLAWIGAEAFISSRHLMSLNRYWMSITIFNGLTKQTKHQLERFLIRTFHLQARRIWIKSLRLLIMVNRKNKHLNSIKNRPLLNSKVLALWFKNTLKNLCCSRRENSTLEFGLWSTLMESAMSLGIEIFPYNGLFRECYVRTSCEDYDLESENLDKIYVHLTNNAI